MTTPTEFEYWGKLTPEMKLECVKHMNFMEKLRLRATSKVEKELVEMNKIDVNKITVADWDDGWIMEMELNGEEKYKMIVEEEKTKNEQLIPLLAYFLKNGIIGEFDSNETNTFSDENLAVLLASAPYRVTNLTLTGLAAQNDLFLRNCTAGIKSFTLSQLRGEPLDLEAIVRMEELNQVKNWNLREIPDPDFTRQMAEMFIENQVDIGTNCLLRKTNINRFAHAFEEKLVEKKDGEVRIRTEQPDKHILVRESYQNHRIVVIPSDLAAADYLEFMAEHNITSEEIIPEFRRRFNVPW